MVQDSLHRANWFCGERTGSHAAESPNPTVHGREVDLVVHFFFLRLDERHVGRVDVSEVVCVLW